MPVIRYRTRDLTRLLPGTARSMRRMDRIYGRSDDMMIVRGVNVFPTQIEEHLLRIPSLSGHYQIILSREGRLDEMDVQVEPRSLSEFERARTNGADELARAIKEHIGITVRVRVLAPSQVERSAGKAKRVIDKRPKT
jgi:phenylacetate-CoA ligase